MDGTHPTGMHSCSTNEFRRRAFTVNSWLRVDPRTAAFEDCRKILNRQDLTIVIYSTVGKKNSGYLSAKSLHILNTSKETVS